jgi:hypothetical protein
MADDDKQVDIEVVLRDTASQTLRSISREIDNISRKLTETGRKGSDALGRIREKGSEAGVGSGKAGEGVDKFTKSITGLTNALKGPLGLAAAFLAVGKSLSSFAQQRVELSLLTADIGLTTAKIGELKQLLSRKGVSEEATKQFITNIGGQLQDLRTRDVHSDFWRRMALYDDPKLGAGLLRSVREGNIDQAFELLIAHVQELNALGEKGRSRSEYFTKYVLGQAPSQFTDWEEYRRQLIKTTSLTEAEAKKWRKEEADLEHRAEEIGGPPTSSSRKPTSSAITSELVCRLPVALMRSLTRLSALVLALALRHPDPPALVLTRLPAPALPRPVRPNPVCGLRCRRVVAVVVAAGAARAAFH